MSSRGILALALIALAFGAERFAYYSSRTVASFDLRAYGNAANSYASTFAMVSWIVILATFLGAGLCLLIGPRLTAVAGVLLMAVGCFVLGRVQSPYLGFVLCGAGAGLFRVCPYAIAAEVLGSEPDHLGQPGPPSARRFTAMSALAVGLYAVVQVSASLAPSITLVVLDTMGRGWVSALGAGVAIVSALLAGAAAGLGYLDARPRSAAGAPLDPYRVAAPISVPPAAPAAPASAAKELTGLARLAIGAALFSMAGSLVFPPSELILEGGLAARSWIFSINPAIVGLASVVLFVVFLVAALSRWQLTPAPLYGAGLAVVGGGLAILAVGGSWVALFAIGAGVAALGEAVIPLGTAYAALAVRGRGAAVVIAVWLGAAHIASLMGSSFAGISRTASLVLFALLSIGAGITLAIKGRQLHDTYFDAPPG